MGSEVSISTLVERGLCSSCGACAAVCPFSAIEFPEPYSLPRVIDSRCRLCGLCYRVCPQVDIVDEVKERKIKPLATYMARSTLAEIWDVAQCGGVVTTLAMYLLDKGFVDAVVSVSRDEYWHPVPKLITEKSRILEIAGSKYTYVSVLTLLRDVVRTDAIRSVAVIGLPCHMRAIERMRRLKLATSQKVKYLIGIFCMHNFEYSVVKYIVEKFGLDIKSISKMDIKRKFIVKLVDGRVLEVPLKELDQFVRACCRNCPEFVSTIADVCVGSVGAEEGWSTVFVMSERGREIVESAVRDQYLEVKELPEKAMKAVTKLTSMKVRSKW